MAGLHACAGWVCRLILLSPTKMIIRPEPLTKGAFLHFGDVLETDGVNPEVINFGNTQKFGGLA